MKLGLFHRLLLKLHEDVIDDLSNLGEGVCVQLLDEQCQRFTTQLLTFICEELSNLLALNAMTTQLGKGCALTLQEPCRGLQLGRDDVRRLLQSIHLLPQDFVCLMELLFLNTAVSLCLLNSLFRLFNERLDLIQTLFIICHFHRMAVSFLCLPLLVLFGGGNCGFCLCLDDLVVSLRFLLLSFDVEELFLEVVIKLIQKL
mmetsp:Transcript_58349/g.103709  ORF Transcript_58349/g.103709 Transcript_58349/m.103709 type:complete len:201 (+) Transcript_58349:798-1400(+)